MTLTQLHTRHIHKTRRRAGGLYDTEGSQKGHISSGYREAGVLLPLQGHRLGRRDCRASQGVSEHLQLTLDGFRGAAAAKRPLLGGVVGWPSLTHGVRALRAL